ncbi:MAG TPA: response regulator transcription factor [Terriglobia bacterium]|nr:response regulator transcription factor [Terriglobia bacterium]
MRQRILLADDHAIVRDGLRMTLEKADFDVVGAVEDGRTLIKEAGRLNPHVVVADISLPLLNGIESARQLKNLLPRVKVIFLTMHADLTYASNALAAGAWGYVLKSAPTEEIITAIRSALAGKKYLTKGILNDGDSELPNNVGGINSEAVRLTPRQREVLQLLAEGRSIKEIADVLCVSPRTVEFHKYKMMRQLGAHSTAALTRYAIKHGVIVP